MDGPVGVTGATGNLGGRVARRLAASGIPQRLVVRDLSRAPELPAAEMVAAAYGDRSAVRDALDGLTTVFMVSAAESADRVEQHRSFVDAAVDAGVRHIVYTSFVGASSDATFTFARDHAATETHLSGSGLACTFLRNNLYADLLPYLGGEEGVIRGPAGDGRVAVVAQDDIADVAVAVLKSPAQHAGRTYDLTGPEALTLHQLATLVTEVTGRPVRYVPETIDEAYRSRSVHEAPPWQVDAWVSTYTAIAAGEMATVSDDVERLTGHSATHVRDVLAQRD